MRITTSALGVLLVVGLMSACGEGTTTGDGLCVPECDGRECGDDGCGGSCGKCPMAAPSCHMGLCVVDCEDCGDRECGFDGCGNPCGTCPAAAPLCVNGYCMVEGEDVQCQPDCSSKQCGPDGCGGTCGQCPQDKRCVQGLCQSATCQKDCVDRVCGDDGCGGSCGLCADGELCMDGACVGDCGELAVCGTDCCEECCGESECCGGDEVCVSDPETLEDYCCQPDCYDRSCGEDGCQGSCGTCSEPLTCDTKTGQCVSDQPICDCGDNICDSEDCGEDSVSCPKDCGFCGDGKCAGSETMLNCSADCEGCGDGKCAGNEDCDVCSVDCQCLPGQICADNQCINCDEYCSQSNADCGALDDCDCGDCSGCEASCISNKCEPVIQSKYECSDGDIYWFDSCGNLGTKKSDCQYGCVNGETKCISEADYCNDVCLGKQCGVMSGCSCGSCSGCESECVDNQCIPESHSTFSCINNDIWWLDSCGDLEDKKTDCNSLGCISGSTSCCSNVCGTKECGTYNGCNCGSCSGCESECSNNSCEAKTHNSYSCYNGSDIYYFDSCGDLEDKKTDCNAMGCPTNGTSCCSTICGSKECGSYNGCNCGTCTGCESKCVNNICQPESQDYYQCHNGDVWWFDSCDDPQSIKTDCGSCGLCSNSSCTPNCSSSSCLASDCSAVITCIKKEIDEDIISDDEVIIHFTIQNNGSCTQEYSVELWSSSTHKCDTEPDSYWYDIPAGGKWSGTVDTLLDSASLEDLSDSGGFIVKVYCYSDSSPAVSTTYSWGNVGYGTSCN